MKLRYILMLLLMIFGKQALADEYQGQVVFFSYSEQSINSQDQDEIDSDFPYHVGNLTNILDKKHIKYSIKNTSEFIVTTMNGKKVRITKTQIPVSTGYIMIKKNGEYLIRNGMDTDVDMMLDIYEYFGIKL